MNLPQLIQHLRQLEAKATKSDWPNDTELIAESRNALPTLLSALESAIEVIKKCAGDKMLLDEDGPGTMIVSGMPEARTWLRENGIGEEK